MKKFALPPALFLASGACVAIIIMEWSAGIGTSSIWAVLAVITSALGSLVKSELSAPWRVAAGLSAMAAGTCLMIGISATSLRYYDLGIMFTMPGVLLLVITILIAWLVPRAYPHTTPS